MHKCGSFVLKGFECGSFCGRVIAEAGPDKDVGRPTGMKAGLRYELTDESGGADDEDSAIVLGCGDTSGHRHL